VLVGLFGNTENNPKKKEKTNTQKKKKPIAEQPHTRCFRKLWQLFIDDCGATKY
jgi:hypothetical protein